MKKRIYKDIRKRKLFKTYEVKRRILLGLINDLSIPLEKRLDFVTELNRLPRSASKVRVVNRCILTGRSKSVYKFCKLSRLSLRRLGSEGLIPGLSKKSW
uniref:Ribosomal protein S14 n=1 Tax=Chloropicon mariensis TaxID=1606511 RepID=A0A4D6C4P0_9CHLO|nr:ribosomal protein S14 [Chloropicon mariensis]QBX98716.1 ribosomal protein S14 [Chloropicon mariensis]